MSGHLARRLFLLKRLVWRRAQQQKAMQSPRRRPFRVGQSFQLMGSDFFDIGSFPCLLSRRPPYLGAVAYGGA